MVLYQGMRAAALILLLTLIGPPVAAVVCNLDCIEHQSAAKAMAASCHQHADDGDTTLSDAGQAVCHDQDARLAALVILTIQITAAPAVAHPPATAVEVSTRAALADITRFSPPAIRTTATPLRI